MAKSTPKPGRGTPARAAAKSKLKSSAGEGDAVESSRFDFDLGVAIFTTIVLIAALVLLDKVHATYLHGKLF